MVFILFINKNLGLTVKNIILAGFLKNEIIELLKNYRIFNIFK